MEGEKRGIGLNEYNGEMRKGGRGGAVGVVFRSPGSKEVGACEPGPYYDKVFAFPYASVNGVSLALHFLLTSLIWIFVVTLINCFSIPLSFSLGEWSVV